jgi:hypothetical protein
VLTFLHSDLNNISLTDIVTGTWADREIDRQAYGQADRLLDRHMDGQTDEWTDR